MHIPGARVIVARAIDIGTPSGRMRRLMPGDTFWCPFVFYPGEPVRVGGSRTMPDWGFWSSGDIDSAFILLSEDVSRLIVPRDVELPPAFGDAPFMVDREAAR